MKQLSETEAKKTIGVAGLNTKHGNLYADEFLRELRGTTAIKTFREMRDNDATVGAVLYAVEQILRDVEITPEPSDKNSEQAVKMAQFVTEVLEDMDHTLDDHISEALSFLTYGFSVFEVTYKRRVGPKETSSKKKSRFSDGLIGIKKISSRAPWTVKKFVMDGDEVIGFEQIGNYGLGAESFIPKRKMVHYHTTTLNGDPSGRSILRNAYTSWYYLKNTQHFEAVGVERDLAGIPVGRMPAEYLAGNATEDQIAVRQMMETVLRDTKKDEAAFMLLPSDTYTDPEGRPTNVRLVDVELMSTAGTRSVDTDKIIKRYKFDIASTMMAEFINLGSSDKGSYAMSKSKSDLFLRSLESYAQTIADVIDRQIITPLWEINGFDFDLKPVLKVGDVAPHDLQQISGFLRNLNNADIGVADQIDVVDALLHIAELPPLDREVYAQSRQRTLDLEDKRYTSDGVENAAQGSQPNGGQRGNADTPDGNADDGEQNA